MLILGLETSCDETAAAVVEYAGEARSRILSNVVFSQLDKHKQFGGVVPEIAARSHVECIDTAISQSLNQANTSIDQIDGIAVTAGPGLIGGLVVGLITAQTIAMVSEKPLFAINHLEGHILIPRLNDNISFPYLSLIVSGGHTQFISVERVGQYTRLGTTIDDALGEAFDKTAKLLRLPYPGGPSIEEYAKKGNAKRFNFPKAINKKGNFDLSFSGLKTAVRTAITQIQPLQLQDIQDIAASFQTAVTGVLESKTRSLLKHFAQIHNLTEPIFVLTGGVAANGEVRTSLEKACKAVNGKLVAPPRDLCTDNGAMIAWAGAERLAAGIKANGMNTSARSRWPLDNLTPTKIGYGRRGAKV